MPTSKARYRLDKQAEMDETQSLADMYRARVLERFDEHAKAFLTFAGSAGGSLSRTQFKDSLAQIGLELSDDQRKALRKEIDKDGDKKISRVEWDAFFAGAGVGDEGADVELM
jgi:Ca2+-binding EF-hand superfamily protein